MIIFCYGSGIEKNNTLHSKRRAKCFPGLVSQAERRDCKVQNYQTAYSSKEWEFGDTKPVGQGVHEMRIDY